jgi:serine O-acetyltransferase
VSQRKLNRVVYARRWPIIGKLAYALLKALGVEIPISVAIGKGFDLVHGGVGVVIHPKATIGSNVKVYQGVTLGRADIYRPSESSQFVGITIDDNAILCPGAKVLCKSGILRVGKGTVIGANAVLLVSTGDWEIWAGAPARKVGEREP